MVEKVARLWMRMGDTDDYNDFDSPFEAGDVIGAHLGEIKAVPSIRKYGKYGVEVDSFFRGPYNYVSLYWGDDDAQPIRSITLVDIADFKAGIADGAGIEPTMRSKPVKRKTKSKSRSQGVDTGLRGIR